MGDKSSIQWLVDGSGAEGATWNPIRARNTKTGKVGWHCEHASIGCIGCYSEAMNRWRGTGLPFKPGHLTNGDVELFLDDEMLQAPLRWTRPRRIFPCSMTDLFADFMPDEWIDQMFGVMALAERHTFLPLTKRPARAATYFGGIPEVPHPSARDAVIEGEAQSLYARLHNGEDPSMWLAVHLPLKNVWLGVSVENQATADERLPILRDIPNAMPWVSYEPALEFVDFGDHLSWLKWVVIGGHSGAQAKDFNLAWGGVTLARCAAYGVAAFAKQVGRRPYVEVDGLRTYLAISDAKGGNMADWPEALRVRQYPT